MKNDTLYGVSGLNPVDVMQLRSAVLQGADSFHSTELNCDFRLTYLERDRVRWNPANGTLVPMGTIDIKRLTGDVP